MAKKRIIKSRHKNTLRENLPFTARSEVKLRQEMEQAITKAFPNKDERRNYIIALIEGLENE